MLSISLRGFVVGCRVPNSENPTSSVCATVAVAVAQSHLYGEAARCQGLPVTGGITPKLVEVAMMPSHTVDETAKRPPTSFTAS